MGIMVYSLLRVMQDLYHQPYGVKFRVWVLWYVRLVPCKVEPNLGQGSQQLPSRNSTRRRYSGVGDALAVVCSPKL